MPIPPVAPQTFHDIVSRSSWGIMLARESIDGRESEPSAITGQDDIASTARQVESAFTLPAPAAALEHAKQAVAYLNQAYDTLAPFAAQDPDWPSDAGREKTFAELTLADTSLREAADASK